jgi:hypothetical protein
MPNRTWITAGCAAVLAGLAAAASSPTRAASAPQRAPVAAQAAVSPATPPYGPARAVRGAVTENVIVISIDGLRPDAIARYDARVLSRLMQEGSYSLTARTIQPSKTVPSHMSMVTGVPPTVHGVTWNVERPAGTARATTIFEVARAGGLSTAAFVSKPKLKQLGTPGSLDHLSAPSGIGGYSAAETVEAAARYIRFRRPNLLFVHLREPDGAGHTLGWMSAPYGWAVRRADGAVGQILKAADAAYGAGAYSVIVTADHGGHGRNHGGDSDDDVQIPWIAWGAGVAANGQLRESISTMDTAATVLWLLGLPAPAGIEGRSVTSAYTTAAQHAASSSTVR